MNLANRLTLFRVALVAVFLTLIEFPFRISFSITTEIVMRLLAIVVFTGAMITDLYDGKIARKYNMITDFGKLMDPLADKILITSALLSYVSKHYISVWVAMIIITREFFVTGIRLIGASKGRIIAAGKLGKHKTAWQIVLIYELLVEETLSLGFEAGLIPFIKEIFVSLLVLRFFLIGVAIFFTIYSAFKYFVQNIEIFKGEDL